MTRKMRPGRLALLFLAACCSAALLIRSAKLGWTLKFSSEEDDQNVPSKTTFGRDDPQEQQQRQQEERRGLDHAQLDHTQLRAPPVPVNLDGKETNATMAAVFVFGMHHTGTSLLTMLLEQLGLDTGGRDGLLMDPNNPAKFFELGQAVALDENFVHGGYGYGYAWEKVRPSTRASFLRAIGNIVQWLDRRAGGLRSWVMKDPRASLVAEQWLSRVNTRRRICVLTARDPIVSASRFSKDWMPGMPLQRSIDLWEEHYVRAIEGCRRTGAKIIISNHEQLVTHPYEAAQRLLAKLREAGVQSLSLPSPESFEANYTNLWKNPSSHVNMNDAEPARRAYFSRFISPRAKLVWEALESENLELLSDEELRPQSWKAPVTWISK